VSLTEEALDAIEPPLHCLESANITPDKNQAKCEDGLTKALVKFVGAKAKCYLTCGANAFKDKVTLAACTPPASDPETPYLHHQRYEQDDCGDQQGVLRAGADRDSPVLRRQRISERGGVVESRRGRCGHRCPDDRVWIAERRVPELNDT
jgi:hypothetical protein